MFCSDSAVVCSVTVPDSIQNGINKQPYCSNGISPTGNLGCFPGESQLQQSRAIQLTVYAGCFKCFHNPLNSDMDYRIFNKRADVNAWCTDMVYTEVYGHRKRA